MGFSRQEYWSGLPFPSPGDLSNPGIEPETSELQVDSLPLIHLGSPGNHPCSVYHDKGQSRGSKNNDCIYRGEHGPLQISASLAVRLRSQLLAV